MKLNELLQENETVYLTDAKEISLWLNNHGNENIRPADISILSDGRVNITEYRIYLRCYVGSTPLPSIPIKFGIVKSMWVEGNQLEDFSFLPTCVHGGVLSLDKNKLKHLSKITTEGIDHLNVRKCDLTSLEGCPNDLISLSATGNNITSLVGVHEHISRMQDRGELELTWNNIDEGGLGLIMIPGLTYLKGAPLAPSREYPWGIISKYLGQPESLYDCQTELIENGFEEYAKL